MRALSKKEYTDIAAEFKLTEVDQNEKLLLKDLAYRIANVFAKHNPRFKRDLFLKACSLSWAFGVK